MPFLGEQNQPRAWPAFFSSFHELDDWWNTHRNPLFRDPEVLPYVSRDLEPVDGTGKGKLLVSHDYAGGYTENATSKSYTFNWWSSTHYFNYFSHNRITIPPPEWITAAHRQGVPILGTLIFEGTNTDDVLRMVVGNLPANTNITALAVNAFFNSTSTIPVSPYYARLLASLAHSRGFDGYLINIEQELPFGSAQARGLAAWLTLFRREIMKSVGQHGKVIWYDGVTAQGALTWQLRLNTRNLPWFLSASGMSTDYTWYNHFPRAQTAFFSTVDPSHISGPLNAPKALNDIFVGVDMWGRGSHGGGGFGAYKALEHIFDPHMPQVDGEQSTYNASIGGLSVSLFAPAWTWEVDEQSAAWSWDGWRAKDTALWVGSRPQQRIKVEIPELVLKPTEQPCTHGEFKPMSTFFPPLPPPNPSHLAFYTSFSPGVGEKWFVEGKGVANKLHGWTDIDKQTALGDLVWPAPAVVELGTFQNGGDRGVLTNAGIDFGDAWHGGSSLRVRLVFPESRSLHTGPSKLYWMPIQGLSLTPGLRYEAAIVYKIDTAEIDLQLDIRSPTGEPRIKIVSAANRPTAEGWQKSHITFDVLEQSTTAVGVLISARSNSTVIRIGQLTAAPSIPPSHSNYAASLLYLTFQAASDAPKGSLAGELAWEIVASLPQPEAIERLDDALPDKEDSTLPWDLVPSAQEWFPRFLYFNVYAVEMLAEGGRGESVWLGTTAYGGETTEQRFYVFDDNIIGRELDGEVASRTFKFEIEGVLENGECIRWDRASSGLPLPVVSSSQSRLARFHRRAARFLRWGHLVNWWQIWNGTLEVGARWL